MYANAEDPEPPDTPPNFRYDEEGSHRKTLEPVRPMTLERTYKCDPDGPVDFQQVPLQTCQVQATGNAVPVPLAYSRGVSPGPSIGRFQCQVRAPVNPFPIDHRRGVSPGPAVRNGTATPMRQGRSKSPAHTRGGYAVAPSRLPIGAPTAVRPFPDHILPAGTSSYVPSSSTPVRPMPAVGAGVQRAPVARPSSAQANDSHPQVGWSCASLVPDRIAVSVKCSAMSSGASQNTFLARDAPDFVRQRRRPTEDTSTPAQASTASPFRLAMNAPKADMVIVGSSSATASTTASSSAAESFTPAPIRDPSGSTGSRKAEELAQKTPAEVADWMVEVLGLRVSDDIRRNCIREQVNGCVLLSLTEEEMSSVLGIKEFGRRRELTLALSALRAATLSCTANEKQESAPAAKVCSAPKTWSGALFPQRTALSAELHHAIRQDDVQSVRSLLEARATADARDENGIDAMSLALLRSTKPEVLRLVLEASGNVETRTSAGWTLVHLWSICHPLNASQKVVCREKLRILVKLSADLNAHAEPLGATPLRMAAAAFQEHSSKVRTPAETPVSSLQAEGAKYQCALLLSSRADPWLRGCDGQAALDVVVPELRPELLQMTESYV